MKKNTALNILLFLFIVVAVVGFSVDVRAGGGGGEGGGNGDGGIGGPEDGGGNDDGGIGGPEDEPSPDEGGGDAGECSPGQTQSQGCGNCGVSTRTCQSNRYWGGWSGCQNQGSCSPGQSQSQSCGLGGSQSRSCTSSCQWGGWSSCTGQGSCSPGQTQSQGCGLGGSQSRTCGSNYQWGGWGSCTGQGSCSPGQQQSQGCGNCGSQSRTCGSNYQWGGWNSCTGQGSCSSGQQQSQGCGYGGTRYSTCSSSCSWGGWGSCQGSGECSPGSTSSTSCGTNVGVCTTGSQSRTCQSNYYWSSWGSCSGVSASSEVCDGLDNDCDGSTDEGGVCGPSISGIPDQTINEDSGLNNNIVDLWSYASDPNTPLSSLLYSITSQTGSNTCSCVVDGNRYIDCTTQQDQFGINDVTVRVSDGSDTDTDTFRVTVVNINDDPVVDITHPDATHNNFVENFYVNLIASATDVDGDALTYSINWGDSQVSNGNVQNNVVNIRKAYSSAGNFRISAIVSDGTLTGSDAVDIVVWPYAFNITNLISYDNSDFTNQDSVFYRTEPLYIKFNVIQKDAGFPVPNNMNRVYIYNRDNPSSIYDLTAYNGDANGITIDDGQPSTPDGSYYYYMPNLPITDDILGWNIVFVFSYDGSLAGQAELEIQILNNPIQLSDIPNVNFGATNFDNSVDLDDYVYDIETPDNEITWSYTLGNQVAVSVAADRRVTFTAPAGWIGTETITFIADDNDGSTASDNVIVSSGVPAVTVLTPNGGESLYLSYDITWNAVDFQGDPLTITLEYSSDGVNWINIASNEANDGTYTWDVSLIPQGNYLVRVFAFDGVYTGFDVSDDYFAILSTPPSAVTVKIIAEPSSGVPPLTVSFSAEVTGNEPFSYAWDLDGDGVIDSTDPTLVAIYNEEGSYKVSLTVIDFDNDVGTDTVIIEVDKMRVKTPRRKIHISSIRFENEEIRAGEDLIVYVTFENNGNYDIKDSRATVFVPELALRQRTGHIDLETNQGVTKKFILETPGDAEPGFYDVMIVIYDNGLKRIRYRPIEIVG